MLVNDSDQTDTENDSVILIAQKKRLNNKSDHEDVYFIIISSIFIFLS